MMAFQSKRITDVWVLTVAAYPFVWIGAGALVAVRFLAWCAP